MTAGERIAAFLTTTQLPLSRTDTVEHGQSRRIVLGEGDLGGLREGRITGDAIRRFYRVYDRLGFGYAESVYINSLVIELRAAGIPFEREKAVAVWYEGECVGVFRADLVIASKVIVEVKATRVLADAHREQLRNHPRCSNLEV